MRIIIAFLFLFCFVQCKTKINYYQGYIYDLNNKPLEHLLVYQKYDKNNSSLTNTKGYFKIKIKKNKVKRYLMVETSKSELLDSIQVIGTQGGEKIIYSFIEGRNDTLYIATQKK